MTAQAAEIGSAAAGCAPYLVLAHHRSGSNFLNDLLQAHPRIECINEPLSMHTRYFRECDLSTWSGADYDPELLHPSLVRHAALRSFLVDLHAYLSQSNDLRVIGFKETVLFGKLGWLKAFLPGLRVVFLKRDPLSIVSSVLRSDLIGLWDYAHHVPAAFKSLFPGYVSRVAAGDEAAVAAEMVAMSVAARYELARRSIQRFEHIEVQLEKLMEHPRDHLEQVMQFLGVDAHEAPLSFMTQRQVSSRGGTFSSFRRRDDVAHAWRRDLSVQQVRAVEDVMRCAQEQ